MAATATLPIAKDIDAVTVNAVGELALRRSTIDHVSGISLPLIVE
jgi:hypothetical protein